MPTITTPPLLLGGDGRPANGFLAGKQTTRFTTTAGIITTTPFRAVITNGQFFAEGGGPLVLPATPTGEALEVFEILFGTGQDGRQIEAVNRRMVQIPGGATAAYSDLIVLEVMPVGGWVTPPYVQTLIDQVNADAAQVALDRTAVANDRTAVAADRVAVEAVPTTTDTLIAGQINTTTSATRGALNATIDTQLEADVPPLVITALANDSAPATAAAAAVQSEVDSRSLIEAPVIPDHEQPEIPLGFVVVDEDGLRTEIETGVDGRFTQRILDSLYSRLEPQTTSAAAAAVGIEIQNAAITQIAFAVVDEDGLRTELEVGMDGRLTQRVIDSINARITYPEMAAQVDPTKILLPSQMSAVIGATYKLRYEDFIGALSNDDHPTTSGRGFNIGTHWLYTPSTVGVSSLTITILDRIGTVVKTVTRPLTTYAAPAITAKRHLCIGDSITRPNTYGKAVTDLLPGLGLAGTRTYDNGASSGEGRGGWRLRQCFTQFGHAEWGDSPFLFPVGIAGDKFRGNTNFWNNVCNVSMSSLPSNGYDFDGFQYMGRGWLPAGNPNLFDGTGYPVTPADGDVVVDPTKAANATILQYSAGVWGAMPAQPAVEFSFSKYILRHAAAFASGLPTSISMMYETNDFYGGLTDENYSTWKVDATAMIASIREWSATVPFIIIIAPTGGPPANWAAQSKQKFNFDQTIRDAASRIMADFDTSAMRTNRVYVTTFMGSVLPENYADHVHPSSIGHAEFAPWLAGTLAKLITEGA